MIDPKTELSTLQIRSIPIQTKRDFNAYAKQHGMTLAQLFIEMWLKQVSQK